MPKNKPIKHYTAWEDQEVAMLQSCGDYKFSPNNAPIISLGTPIQCPHCGDYIKLVWNVYIKEISEEEFIKQIPGNEGYE